MNPTKGFKMVKVKSGNIAAIDFNGDGDDPGTLRVEFKNGRTYEYSDVPPAVYHELLDAASKVDEGVSVGRTFNRLVREGAADGRYSFTEVDI